MKIDMHLFCLIGALATGITDGRISSSSQPVGGSAMEVTPPNQRELEPAIEYCTAIDRKTGDGKQRGVVDWQGLDQCHKCEGGQLWWPCGLNLCEGSCTPETVCDERIRAADLQPALVDSKPHYCTVTDVGQRRGVVDQCHKCEGGQKHWPCNDENLCAGFCTPEAVCKERLKVVAAKTVETAASDCATVIAEKNVLEETIESLRETKYCSYMACIDECREKEDFQAFRDKIRQEIEEEETSAATGSDCSAVNEDNVSLREIILYLEETVADLEDRLEYCTAIDRIDGDGKQRGVVDWQNFDQCHKCEGGQLWWPCGDSNLCIGFCTPKDVCDERILRLEAAAAATTSTAADCTAVIVEKNVLEETIESLRETKYCSYMASIDECQEKEDFQAFRDKIRQEIEEEEETSAATGSDCSAVNEDNNSLRAKILELEKVIEILDPDESEGC